MTAAFALFLSLELVDKIRRRTPHNCIQTEATEAEDEEDNGTSVSVVAAVAR